MLLVLFFVWSLDTTFDEGRVLSNVLSPTSSKEVPFNSKYVFVNFVI